MSDIQLETSWLAQLRSEFDQPYMQQLKAFLQRERAARKHILPKASEWFTALNTTPYDQLKVVILGQDPYPTPGHAHGLCFSVQPGVALPKSLRNIYTELESDIGCHNWHSGNLMPWATQGILLLNTVLTVEAGKPNSHQNRGWETFTDAILHACNAHSNPLVFVLWGSKAQSKRPFIDTHKHKIIASPHPSPLSAYRGFFGSKPFSQINHWLQHHQQVPIHWQLPH